MSRIETIPDDDRYVVFDDGPQRLWMNHFGAKVRELHRLVVGHLLNDSCLRYPIRIRTQDAVNVCPDRQLRSVAQSSEYSR